MPQQHQKLTFLDYTLYSDAEFTVEYVFVANHTLKLQPWIRTYLNWDAAGTTRYSTYARDGDASPQPSLCPCTLCPGSRDQVLQNGTQLNQVFGTWDQERFPGLYTTLILLMYITVYCLVGLHFLCFHLPAIRWRDQVCTVPREQKEI